MDFNPKDANAHLIQGEPWLQAVIVSAEDKVSRSGNQMIEAVFKVYDDAGKQPTITHYFVANFPGMFKKLCRVIGIDFESGHIPASDLVNKNVVVLVKIQKDDKYGDKNVIAAFSDKLPEGATSAHESRTAEDDGIPF